MTLNSSLRKIYEWRRRSKHVSLAEGDGHTNASATWEDICLPPPLCATTALSNDGVGVGLFFLGIFGTAVFVVPNV